MFNSTTILKRTAALTMGICCLTASAAVNWIADPDPNVTVSELSSVTLTFPDAENAVDFGSQYMNVTITSENFSKNCTLNYGDNDNQMVVSFDKITAEGTYTINFPADAITDGSNPMEAFAITYNIGKETTTSSTLIPAPGDVDWLYSLVFYNPGITENLGVDSYGAPEKPYVTSPSGEVSELSAVYDYLVGAGKYRFTLRRLAVEPGEYTVSFPGNYLYYQDASYNKVYLPACEFKYEVKGATLTEVVSDPSMTRPAHNFNFLNLEFPGYTTISLKENMSYSESTIPVYIEGKDDSVTSLLLTNFQAEGNKLSFTNQYSDYITPGHYYLTVPEGLILLGEDKQPCTPFAVDFEICTPDPVKIDLTPSDGATVSMLRSAVISFPEISKVELARSPYVSLYKVTGEGDEEKTVTVGGTNSVNSFVRLSDNSFLATFNGMATADGDYLIRLSQNSFVFDGGFNQEYEIKVKFIAPEEPEYTMTPDNSEALPKLQKFTITFPKESVVKLNEALSNKKATLYDGDELIYSEYGYLTNSTIGSTSEYTAVEGTTNSFTFTLTAAGLDKGKYLLVIPAGVFLMGEDETNFSGAVSLVYECNGEGFDKTEVTPSVPVNELKEISIKFIDETSISFANAYPGITLFQSVEGQTYGNYIDYISGDGLKIEGNTLLISLQNAITEKGTYYLDINQYLLKMSDGETACTPQKIYFEVDPNAGTVSVGSMEQERTDNRIFTVSGLEVKDMKTPGIYVVNGRKVVVR